MAQYKPYSYNQQLMIPVSLSKQILPKTFEYKYSNDETGAPDYDPAIFLKVILYAYSKDITGSRKIFI